MFGLEGSGFIVAIAVTLLLAGAIVYYCNTRITAMEKAIVKQNPRKHLIYPKYRIRVKTLRNC